MSLLAITQMRRAEQFIFARFGWELEVVHSIIPTLLSAYIVPQAGWTSGRYHHYGPVLEAQILSDVSVINITGGTPRRPPTFMDHWASLTSWMSYDGTSVNHSQRTREDCILSGRLCCGIQATWCSQFNYWWFSALLFNIHFVRRGQSQCPLSVDLFYIYGGLVGLYNWT